MSTRRWFQFHLATGIVLMLTAAILLGLNFRGTQSSYIADYDLSGAVFDPIIQRTSCRGWPVPLEYPGFTNVKISGSFASVGGKGIDLPVWSPDRTELRPVGLAIDIGTALAILALTALCSEHFLRRQTTTNSGTKNN